MRPLGLKTVLMVALLQASLPALADSRATASAKKSNPSRAESLPPVCRASDRDTATQLSCSLLWAYRSERNGVYWRKLGQLDQALYIIGFFDGGSYTEDLFLSTLSATREPSSVMANPEAIHLLANSGKAAFLEYDRQFSGYKAGWLVDKLNTLYADERNRVIPIRLAIQALMYRPLNVQSLEFEARLEKLRKVPSIPGEKTP